MSGGKRPGGSQPGAGGGERPTKARLRTALGRTVSQQRWLQRQLNDPYVAAAKREGYRSRAAFKLLELDDQFRLLRPGIRILDLGAAPGGWAQVALRRGAATVVGIDLLPIDPLGDAHFVQGDINDAETDATLRGLLGGHADLVLSDMAPNTTGHAATDHIRIIALAELAFAVAETMLVADGAFVAKVFQGGSERGLLDALKRGFRTVRHAKPKASRKESSELYVVATGFRGAGAG